MSVKDPIANLINNAWNWDLHQFCSSLGWDEDLYAEEQFERFQAAANALRQFDRETLAILTRGVAQE